jgi:predicted nucleic acid-binding protein
VTTVFYLAAKERDTIFARAAIEDLLTVFGVAEVTGAVLRRALTLGWPDFEDAVCAAAAEAAQCDAIVTRDPSGFRSSPVEVFDPPMAVAWLVASEG